MLGFRKAEISMNVYMNIEWLYIYTCVLEIKRIEKLLGDRGALSLTNNFPFQTISWEKLSSNNLLSIS